MKKKLLPKILFYYSALASFFVAVSAALTSKTLGPVIFVLLFLPVTAFFVIEFFKQLRASFSKKPQEESDISLKPRKGETIFIIIIFLVLSSLGVRNVIVNSAKKIEPTSQKKAEATSSPLVFKKEEKTQTRKIEIAIEDGSSFVNVRQKPSVYSEILGEAKSGESYEYIQISGGWYEIKFKDNALGYISSKYAKERKVE